MKYLLLIPTILFILYWILKMIKNIVYLYKERNDTDYDKREWNNFCEETKCLFFTILIVGSLVLFIFLI